MGRRKKRGRPKSDENSHTILTVLPTSLFQRIENARREMRWSRSRLLREAVIFWLEADEVDEEDEEETSTWEEEEPDDDYEDPGDDLIVCREEDGVSFMYRGEFVEERVSRRGFRYFEIEGWGGVVRYRLPEFEG